MNSWGVKEFFKLALLPPHVRIHVRPTPPVFFLARYLTFRTRDLDLYAETLCFAYRKKSMSVVEQNSNLKLTMPTLLGERGGGNYTQT